MESDDSYNREVDLSYGERVQELLEYYEGLIYEACNEEDIYVDTTILQGEDSIPKLYLFIARNGTTHDDDSFEKGDYYGYEYGEGTLETRFKSVLENKFGELEGDATEESMPYFEELGEGKTFVYQVKRDIIEEELAEIKSTKK